MVPRHGWFALLVLGAVACGENIRRQGFEFGNSQTELAAYSNALVAVALDEGGSGGAAQAGE